MSTVSEYNRYSERTVSAVSSEWPVRVSEYSERVSEYSERVQ